MLFFFFYGQNQISHQPNLESDRSQCMPLNQINQTNPPKFLTASKYVISKVCQLSVQSPAHILQWLFFLSFFCLIRDCLVCLIRPVPKIFCYFKSLRKNKNHGSALQFQLTKIVEEHRMRTRYADLLALPKAQSNEKVTTKQLVCTRRYVSLAYDK